MTSVTLISLVESTLLQNGSQKLPRICRQLALPAATLSRSAWELRWRVKQIPDI